MARGLLREKVNIYSVTGNTIKDVKSMIFSAYNLAVAVNVTQSHSQM